MCKDSGHAVSMNKMCEKPLQSASDILKHMADHNASHLSLGTIADARRQPRFKIKVDITINSRTGGMLKGHTLEISESGIAAMLSIEAPLGEIVELSFALPCGSVRIHATVRQRNAFRYGFEFVDQELVHEFIRRTCRDLAVDRSMTWPDLP